ncbi:MAG: MYPU_1760 family metalloprotease [Metamycoplasmataceae bacterium]
MKFNKSMILKGILFALTLGAVGTGVWFVTSALINIVNTNNSDQLKPGNKETVTLEKSKDVPIKLIEHESDGFFFFGVEGLELLNKRIKSDLQFGPEVETIKSIRINNLSILNENVNGQYNPFTHEMEISILHFIPEFKNIPIEEKVELVFPTIFHEYGHHFATTYITSIATNDPRNSKKLFAKNSGKSMHKNIPKVFLDEFEKALHYDDSEVSNLLSNNTNDISSKRSAKYLYEHSNSSNIKYNDGNDYLQIDEFNFSNTIPFRNKNVPFDVKSNRHTYLFSIDELLTRKLQQITYIDRINGKSIANNSTTFTGTEFKNGFLSSTMGADISRNKQIQWIENSDSYTIKDNLLLIDYPYGGNFIDNQGRSIKIESTLNALWNAYYDIGGYDYGISQIFLNNSSIQNSSTTRTTLLRSDFRNIKFTGFLDNSKKYKGLLLKEKNGLYKEHLFSKNNYEYKLMGAKSDVLSKTRDLNKEQNKFGYSTDYIDISKVDFDEPIKVWNDINNNDKFENFESESIKVSPHRPTSTFRESFIRHFDDNVVQIDSDISKDGIFYEVANLSNNAFLQIYQYGSLPKLTSPLMSSRTIDATDSDSIQIPDGVIMFNNRNNKKKR